MSKSVSVQVEGNVAVVEVNNPPVNALSYHVREGIQNAVRQAEQDSRVRALVLIGRRTFIAGADIREFANPAASDAPGLGEVADILENSKKPVVAAVAGFALGGGFEMAISCHYRIALESAMFGFPEVDIGILPAATGSQRYPRLVGLEAALDIIPTGKRLNAKQALECGALDKIVTRDLRKEAINYARSVASAPFDKRCVSKMTVKDAHRAVELRDRAIKNIPTKFKGMIAPTFCIKAVMASVEYPYEEGIQKESEYAAVLFTSGQARALQYAFFAQRSAPRWEVPGVGSHKDTKPLAIDKGAVIGAGTMGSGIAMAMLNAGMTVTLLEKNADLLQKGMDLLKSLYAGSVRVGKMTPQQTKQCLARLRPTVSYRDVSEADVVVEAVFERMDVKQEVFRELDRHCKPSAILASNTSTLDIDKMAAVTARPEKVVGTHFFVPAYYMTLLENVRGAKSSASTLATAQAFGTKLGKVPVLVGNCNGFAANRMRSPLVTEAVFLLEEGCLPEEIDQVMEDFGLALGPLKTSDLSGIDIGVSSRKERLNEQGLQMTDTTRYLAGVRVSPISERLVREGRLGRKTGKGFYHYEKPGAKQAHSDPWMRTFLQRYSEEFGITRRKVSTQEIQERLVYCVINEGFKILEEGICQRPEEIDTLWLLGFGWPRHTGGPMYYADTVGLGRILDRVKTYYDNHATSPHWQPSRLLERLAEGKVPLRKWSQHVHAVPGKL